MSMINLDVTHLFPYPGEVASRPVDNLRASSTLSASTSGAEQVSTATAPVQPSAAELAGSVQQLNVELHSFGIQFELSENDNRLITRVVDSQTGELIRQIPSEEVLRMARSLEQSSGLLLQTQA